MNMKRLKTLSILLLILALLPASPSAHAEDEAGPPIIATDIRISPPADHKDGLVSFTDSPIIVRERALDGTETRQQMNTSIRELLNERCREITREKHGVAVNLEYISYVILSPTQGTLYGGYNAESDPGEGLAGTLRYYYDENATSNYKISDIQFTPASAFSGDAHITYYGHYTYQDIGTNNVPFTNYGSYTGSIYISVIKQVPGISYSTDGEPVRFSVDDFITYSTSVTGRNLRYVTFSPPSASEGALYYNYRDEDIYDYAVTSDMRFYRTTKPYIGNVYFVPSKNAPGIVDLQFHLVDIAEHSPENEPDELNHVTITLTAYGPQHTSSGSGGAFHYEVTRGRTVSLKASDFSALCQSETGSSLNYIRFSSLPEYGTLYDSAYNSSSSNANHYVAVNKTYYSPGNIRYVADDDYIGTVKVPFVAYADNGKWFDGTVSFVVRDSTSVPLQYKVDPGKRVYCIANDFSDACYAATGYDISRIHFDSLPSSSYGALYSGGTPITTNKSNTYYYKSSLNNISFLAAADFDTALKIPFTGYATSYTSSNGRSFSGTITITSTAQKAAEQKSPIGGTSSTITYYTTQFPVPLRQSDIVSAASAALPGAPVTLTLDRADPAAGTLQFDMSTLFDRTEFDPRRTYSVSDISHVSFLPKAGFSGTTRIGYTAKDADGNSFTGNINFVVTPNTRSLYFDDLGNYAWATPAIDFLRTYGVTTGVSPKYFAPGIALQRADFVLLLSRAFGFPAAGTESFKDVSQDAYYAAAIASAKEIGLISGSSRGLFNPEGTISREEAATYLFRALQRYRGVEAGSAADLVPFSDAGDISSVAVPAMGALVRLGILNGDNGRLRPGRELSRAETMTILYRAFT